METLPLEALSVIVSFLPLVEQRYTIRAVNRKWRKAGDHEAVAEDGQWRQELHCKRSQRAAKRQALSVEERQNLDEQLGDLFHESFGNPWAYFPGAEQAQAISDYLDRGAMACHLDPHQCHFHYVSGELDNQLEGSFLLQLYLGNNHCFSVWKDIICSPFNNWKQNNFTVLFRANPSLASFLLYFACGECEAFQYYWREENVQIRELQLYALPLFRLLLYAMATESNFEDATDVMRRETSLADAFWGKDHYEIAEECVLVLKQFYGIGAVAYGFFSEYLNSDEGDIKKFKEASPPVPFYALLSPQVTRLLVEDSHNGGDPTRWEHFLGFALRYAWGNCSHKETHAAPTIGLPQKYEHSEFWRQRHLPPDDPNAFWYKQMHTRITNKTTIPGTASTWSLFRKAMQRDFHLRILMLEAGLPLLCRRKDRKTFQFLFEMDPRSVANAAPQALECLQQERGKKERLVQWLQQIQKVAGQKKVIQEDLIASIVPSP